MWTDSVWLAVMWSWYRCKIQKKKKSGLQDSEAWPLPASSAHFPHQAAKAGRSLTGWKGPKWFFNIFRKTTSSLIKHLKSFTVLFPPSLLYSGRDDCLPFSLSNRSCHPTYVITPPCGEARPDILILCFRVPRNFTSHHGKEAAFPPLPHG